MAPSTNGEPKKSITTPLVMPQAGDKLELRLNVKDELLGVPGSVSGNNVQQLLPSSARAAMMIRQKLELLHLRSIGNRWNTLANHKSADHGRETLAINLVD